MRKVPINLALCAALLALLPITPFLFAGTESLSEMRLRRTAVPRFTLDQAVLTALQRNADIQKARQEIERTKGLYIEMRAEILPQIAMTGQFQDTDPHLQVNHGDLRPRFDADANTGRDGDPSRPFRLQLQRRRALLQCAAGSDTGGFHRRPRHLSDPLRQLHARQQLFRISECDRHGRLDGEAAVLPGPCPTET